MAKNQYTQRKPLYFEKSSSKIGHDFRKKSGSKIEVRKNVFDKKWSPKLTFFNEKKMRKIRIIFDIEN